MQNLTSKRVILVDDISNPPGSGDIGNRARPRPIS